jgi:hypothetical protein
VELNISTIGSYRTHDAIRRVRRLTALGDAIFLACSIAVFLAVVYGAGFVHGLVYADQLNAWANQVIAQ